MSDVKNDVLMKLQTLTGVLGNVEVRGEQNYDNMSGSIKLVREICLLLSKCEIQKTDEKRPALGQAKEE